MTDRITADGDRTPHNPGTTSSVLAQDASRRFFRRRQASQAMAASPSQWRIGTLPIAQAQAGPGVRPDPLGSSV